MNLAFRTVVVATDFSDPSQLALEYARVFARRFGANLRIVHVVHLPVVMSAEVPLPVVQAQSARAVADAEQALADALATLTETEVIGQILIGPPADRIVEYATDHDADLIVMGTSARRGVAHFFMGSVAEQVLREAPCPVFTVKSAEALQCVTREQSAAVS